MSGPSRLRRRVVVERAQDAPDAAGGFSRSWGELGRVWADFRFRRGGPQDRADRPALASVYAVRMRWRNDLDGNCRLRDGSETWVILSCGDPDGRRAWLELTVTKETP